MRYLDGELSAKARERVDCHVTRCRCLQEEIDLFRMLGSDLRVLLWSFEIPRHSIWELIRPKLPRQKGTTQ